LGDALCLREFRLHILQRDQFVEMGTQRRSSLGLDATAKSDDGLTEAVGNTSYPGREFCPPVFVRQGYLRQ
jgi:hypothetical protein